MVLETVYHFGNSDKALIIFIHGIGMDMSVWSNPDEARVLGGQYPLRELVGGEHIELRTSFMDFKDLGYSVLAWSQKRPSGPIKTAVAELCELVDTYKKYTEKGVVLIGHSRGGLIGRKYFEEDNCASSGLLTLATPHHGTTMAKWGVLVSPIASLISHLAEGLTAKEINAAAVRINSFLNSSGLKELLPDSLFYMELSDKKTKEAHYVSIGGTSPDLLKIGTIPIHELISKVLPERLIPEEMREGYGDGLVSCKSAVLPYVDEHRDFHVNHAAMLFDKGVRKYLIDAVKSF